MLLFGWAWYSVALFPVSGLVSIGSLSHADRYTYLPSIGLFFGATWLIWSINHAATKYKIMGFALLVSIFSIQTFQQCKVWKNNGTLLSHAIQTNPTNGKVQRDLGELEFKANRFEQALFWFNRSVKQDQDTETYYSIGKSQNALHKRREAVTSFQKAIAIGNSKLYTYLSHLALGDHWLFEGKPNQAKTEYQTCVRLLPQLKIAQLKIAKMLMKEEKPDLARELLESTKHFNYDPIELRGTLELEKWDTEISFWLDKLSHPKKTPASKAL